MMSVNNCCCLCIWTAASCDSHASKTISWLSVRVAVSGGTDSNFNCNFIIRINIHTHAHTHTQPFLPFWQLNHFRLRIRICALTCSPLWSPTLQWSLQIQTGGTRRSLLNHNYHTACSRYRSLCSNRWPAGGLWLECQIPLQQEPQLWFCSINTTTFISQEFVPSPLLQHITIVKKESLHSLIWRTWWNYHVAQVKLELKAMKSRMWLAWGQDWWKQESQQGCQLVELYLWIKYIHHFPKFLLAHFKKQGFVLESHIQPLNLICAQKDCREPCSRNDWFHTSAKQRLC